MEKKKKTKVIDNMSFTTLSEQKDRIIGLADDYGTNRSWMIRFLLNYSLDRLTHNQIFAAVKKDPESKNRVIR